MQLQTHTTGVHASAITQHNTDNACAHNKTNTNKQHNTLTDTCKQKKTQANTQTATLGIQTAYLAISKESVMSNASSICACYNLSVRHKKREKDKASVSESE